MSRGRPDWTNLSVIKGEYGTELKVVALDASGRIIMVPYGTLQVEGAVDVTQVDKTREVQGKEGATLRTLAVDNSGQIITILKGASGNNVLVDSNGHLVTLVKGNYGGSPVTIALDASGNIVAIMKGSYNGVPTTMAVDDQGRMLAVLTDPADVFGNPHFMGGAELAARLGCISRQYRSGEILIADSFEEGIKNWVTNAPGEGSSVTYTRAKSRSGACSVKLKAGNATPYFASLYRYFIFTIAGKVGIEIAFTWVTGARYFAITLTNSDATYQRSYKLTYDGENSQLLYRDGNYNDSLLASGISLNISPNVWHTMKLIADTSGQNYVRAHLDAGTYDMTDKQGYKTTDAGLPVNLIAFGLTGLSGYAPEIYIDDAIVTQNES